MIKSASIKKLFKYFCLSIYFSVLTPIESYSVGFDRSDKLARTNLHHKYYQQALYCYFQGDYSGALDILSLSKLRLNSLELSTQLFEAGLQIKLGLQEEASKKLLLISNNYSQESKISSSTDTERPEYRNLLKDNGYKDSHEQLLTLALLSLSEQYIERDEVVKARQILGKISIIPQSYYGQYYVLSQLAYWPEQPMLLLPVHSDEFKGGKVGNSQVSQKSLRNTEEYSPYIQLNMALRYINEGKFEQAVLILDKIKTGSWQEPEQSFFQSLFSTESTPFQGGQQEAKIQYQAINDHARLLISHLHVQQEAYDKAYIELATFPNGSAYAESALFLYAFSAQQIKQHTTALALYTFLHEEYPYSNLGWQASLLMAEQVTEQQSLAQGWDSYQKVELFFLEKIDKLNAFEQSFLLSPELKPVSTVNINEIKSKWLEQAISDTSINSLYQQLSEVRELLKLSRSLQEKSDWIVDIIKLNTSRKTRISASQKALEQHKIHQNLLDKRASIATKLYQALNNNEQRGYAFATKKEQAWLERLEQSKKHLTYINKHSQRNNQLSNANFSQRVARIESVLAWRFSQDFPERAWQHKAQLVNLDKSLQQLNSLKNSVSGLLEESAKRQGQDTLMPFVQRQKSEDKKIVPLIHKLEKLEANISRKIREKVARFTQERKSRLGQHILTIRKAMAVVLEEMAGNDNNIEKQLNLDIQVIKESL